MITFEVVVTLDNVKQTKKISDEDRQLLEKMKKYGAFNDKGEWVQG